MWISIIILICLCVYVVVRDIVTKRKRDRDVLLKKRISGKIDRIESKIDIQNNLFERLLDILESKEG